MAQDGGDRRAQNIDFAANHLKTLRIRGRACHWGERVAPVIMRQTVFRVGWPTCGAVLVLVRKDHVCGCVMMGCQWWFSFCKSALTPFHPLKEPIGAVEFALRGQLLGHSHGLPQESPSRSNHGREARPGGRRVV